MIRRGIIRGFHYLNLLADALAVGLALWLAYRLRFSGWPIPLLHDVPGARVYVLALPWVILVVWLSAQYTGLYLQRRGISGVDEFSRVIKAAGAAFLLILGFTFFYREVSYSRVVVFYAWIFSIAFMSFFRSLLRRWQVNWRRQGVGVSRVALVGLTESALQVAQTIRRFPGLGYRMIGVVSGEEQAPEAWNGLRVLGSLADLPRLLKSETLDEIIVALPAGDRAGLEKLLLEAGDLGVEFRIVSDLFGIITNPLETDELNGIPLFALKHSPLARPLARAAKRLLDFSGSAFSLILLSPLFLVLALAVKAGSAGPVFYRQERVTRGNKPFRIYKFRSMRQDAEQGTGPVWASKEDDRRTPIGSFLRKTSLDELPQLLNVLRGEMSLVGPRPERPHFVEQFKQTIPRYLERHKVKAGLSGWAQLHGLRGNTPVEERTKYDLWYVENWSLALDIKIILRTALEVFHHRDAY